MFVYANPLVNLSVFFVFFSLSIYTWEYCSSFLAICLCVPVCMFVLLILCCINEEEKPNTKELRACGAEKQKKREGKKT